MPGNTSCSIIFATLEQKPLISSFLQGYLRELSQYPGEETPTDSKGYYFYQYFDDYWTDGDRYPYLIFSGDRIAGFTFVRTTDKFCCMAEYYIMQQFRRLGLGIECARKLLIHHRGEWLISYNRHNKAGSIMWNRLAEETALSEIKRTTDDDTHIVLRFSTTEIHG